MSIGAAIIRLARDTPDAVAVVEGDRELSYLELDDRTTRLANVLRDEFGLAVGDRVAMLLPNRTAVVEVLGACAKAGTVYCAFNFRLSRSEYFDIFENAKPRVLVTERAYVELAEELSAAQGLTVVYIDDDGPRGYESLLAGAGTHPSESAHALRSDEDFAITYTSGTTGRAKGVHFDRGRVIQHALTAAIEYDIDAETRWLLALPHNSCLHITLLPLLLRGGTLVLMEQRSFSSERFAEHVNRHAVTHTFLVPTMLFRILDSELDAASVPTLTTIGYGSSPIPPEHVQELVGRFGPVFIQLYGMSEIASIGTMLRKADHARAFAGHTGLFASAGRASYVVDLRIVDDDDREVVQGERGEVVFGTPYCMTRYYDDEERTAAVLTDGWMRSGDIGHFDDEGYLYIVDRKKDLIISGGLNIVPSEIENVLYAHPAVLEAAVFGVADPEWGERTVAAVAFKDGRSAGAEELLEHCRDAGLATIKVPSRIELLDALPKNAVGKIAKRELRDRFAPARA